MEEKTLRQKIAEVREKLEPYRFKYFRILRTLIMYWLLTKGMKANVLAEDTAYDRPLLLHGMMCCSMIVVFILFCGIFVLYDPTARRRFCKEKPQEKSVWSESIFVLRSYEFIVESVCLAILPLVFGVDMYVHPAYLIFRRDDLSFWETYGVYLLTALPVFLLIEFFMRVRTRSFWRTLTYDVAADKHMDAVALIFLSALILVGYPLIAGIYLVTFAMIGAVIVKYGIWVLLGAVCVFFLWRAFAYARAIRIRCKFLKKLKKLCKAEDITISEISRPYRSLFTQKRSDFQFTVEMGGKTYACKLIGAMAKNMPMLFCDKDSGYFKYGYCFRGKEIVFWREWFTHGFDAQEADKKLLIVLPAPRKMQAVHMHTLFATDNVTYISEGKGERPLENASVLYDVTVFSGSGFINAIKRDCLDKRADF